MVIRTVRTTRGREKTVINSIEASMKNEEYSIQAVLFPQDLKGYLFLEGEEADIKDLVRDIRHAKGVIDEPVDIEEIKDFMADEPQEITLEAGDKVEVIGGPYKGDEAKIERIDEANHEATIKLLEAAVPIPLTISIEHLRKRSDE